MIDFTTDMYFTQNTAIYSKLQSVEKNTSVVPLGSTNKISIAYFTTKIFAVWVIVSNLENSERFFYLQKMYDITYQLILIVNLFTDSIESKCNHTLAFVTKPIFLARANSSFLVTIVVYTALVITPTICNIFICYNFNYS